MNKLRILHDSIVMDVDDFVTSIEDIGAGEWVKIVEENNNE